MNLEELRRYKPQILALADEYGVTNIRVFGSVARGDADEDSDVDFLIQWKYPSFDNYYNFKTRCGELLGHSVDLVEEPFIRNPIRKRHILKDAVVL